MSNTSMNTPAVTWEEPTTARRGRKGVMPAIVEQLKSRPGQWARIEVAQATASTYAMRHPEIEVTSRNKGKPNEAVYARYIGTEATDA